MSVTDPWGSDDAVRAALAERDRRDPLAARRDLFDLPEGLIYLDGNSLGPLPKASRDRLRRVVDEEWGQGLIRSWNMAGSTGAGWIDLAKSTAAKIAPLLGAEADRVQVADSTSVNLFKLLTSALDLRPGRSVVLSEEEQFPSDLYVAEEITRRHPTARLEVVPRRRLAAALDERVAVLALTHVDFRSGEIHDLAALTGRAHEVGAVVVWDLAHSAGAVPLELDAWGVDFAVGCGYKFLNGGPGAPAFLYVAPRWWQAVRNPIAGWLGHADPFAFDLEYRPASGSERFVSGTPPILSLAALDAALDAFEGVSSGELHTRALELGDLFLERVESRCAGFDVEPVCPPRGAMRGAQVAFRHRHAFAIVQALIERRVVGDFRTPDVMRFGLAPLYLRRTEIYDAVEILAEVLDREAWRDPRYQHRGKVT